jgi:hypothetical protein
MPLGAGASIVLSLSPPGNEMVVPRQATQGLLAAIKIPLRLRVSRQPGQILSELEVQRDQLLAVLVSDRLFRTRYEALGGAATTGSPAR